MTKYEDDKEVELSFYIDKETSKNKITQQQFNEYMVLCDSRLPRNTDIDYICISWGLDSNYEFQEVLKRNNLLTNNFNSYANVCTAMNLALQKMGYVGLKYSTSEIEDLDDRGLGDKNAYLIFNKSSISELP